MATGYQGLDLNDICTNDNLTYDWEDCETRQIVKAFPISDYGTKSDRSSIEYPLVPEPPSLSGIIDSTISIPQPRTISDVEENFIEDDMSSLTNVSNIKISNAPRRHEYGKKRLERKGNIYAKFYNACLEGELSTIKDIRGKLSTVLMQDEDGQTPLYAACIGNNTEIVKLLIGFGFDVNHQDNEGKTPLHTAFENHAPDVAQTLITQFNANTEIRDKQNWTPLHTALDRGYSSYAQELLEKFLHKDVGTEVSWIQLYAACLTESVQGVQFLLHANTDVNHVSSTGYRPLHIAVDKSNIDLVTLLLDQDININSVTFDEETPLHIAADRGDETIIQKILTQKVDINLKDVIGNTSLHLAVRQKQETKAGLVKTRVSYSGQSLAPYHACSAQTVRTIINHGADLNAVNNQGQTALWFACVDGQDSFARILLDSGADPNIKDKDGESCLHAAIYGHCSTETIQEIIAHGAHVNARNKDGATPLLLASSAAQVGAVWLLMKAKSDPNAANADGDTCLHAAIAADCSIKTIQKIIDYSADVNSMNKIGRTALLLACSYKREDLVKALLKARADPGIADQEGASCLHAAIDRCCSIGTLRALIDHGVDIGATRKDGTNALLLACRKGQSESVRFLLDAGVDVGITKQNGNTCLHEAVSGCCNKDILQSIIQQGVNVNAVNSEGKTALLRACESKQGESVKLLLEMKADPNISDTNGHTSLHAGILGRCTNDILREIITYKVYLNAQNKNGETALLLACSRSQQDSIRILLKAGSNTNIENNDGDACLHAAVLGDCSKKIISSILDHGAYVDAKNKDNVTALLTACTKGNNDVISVFLNAGANVKVADKKNVTALMVACRRRQEGAINVLLNAGAEINTENEDGFTCLHVAVSGHCNKETLHALLDHGADVNATNKLNQTPLSLACSTGNEDTISVLLTAGTDLSITNFDGKTCLHDAVDGGCSKDVLQVLIDHGVDVNVTDKLNCTALMLASKKKNEDAIEVLLNAGADTHFADADGYTCLYYATDGDCSKEVLQAIISYGADVNATNKTNVTALMIACERWNENAINILFNAGANPNIADADGRTCLHYAVENNCSTQVLQSMISQGVNVNATNKKNVTALMIACEEGTKDAVNLLLNAGAEPNIVDADGDTWLHYAARNYCHSNVIHNIFTHVGDVNATNKKNVTALMLACSYLNKCAINSLLNAGADPKIRDTNDNTWLHYAARNYRFTEAIQAIISHGIDLNATNKKNVTALMIACQYLNKGVIYILLNAAADPNIADANGDTFLHYAARNIVYSDVFQAIILHGADVNATNKTNVTAFMLACEKRNKDVIHVFLNAGVDLNIADADGDACFHYAARNYQFTDVLQVIISLGLDVNGTNNKNVTALMLACKEGKKDAIDVLLSDGADPNIADADGATCLHYAARNYRSTDVLPVIISLGLDVNGTNNKNVTALMLACKEGKKDAIDVLLSDGADPNIADADGATCLHYAARNYRSTDVLQVIISLGLDVNGTNNKNVTALMLACKEGKKDAIDVLLSDGADPNIADADGDTCLHYAARNYRSTEVLQAILSHGIDVNATNKCNVTALMKMCQNGNLAGINVLLNAAADIKTVDSFGRTCLHYIFHNGNCDLQSCIDHCIDISDTNIKKQAVLIFKKTDLFAVSVSLNFYLNPNVPLHSHICDEVLQAATDLGADLYVAKNESEAAQLLACNSGLMYECMDELLRSGADTSSVDVFGDTCLHKVLYREYLSLEYDHETLQMLLDYGVPVNVANKNHQTAYMLAFHQGNIDAMCALLNAGADPCITSNDDDDDTIRHHDDTECSSNVTVQTIMQWLNPAWFYLDLLALWI